MKCRRIGLEAEVIKYELGQGLEDGFALWTDVVTKGFVKTDNLVKVEREDGKLICPYVLGSRGCTFINSGDYIIRDADSTKHVCGEDKIWKRYEKAE